MVMVGILLYVISSRHCSDNIIIVIVIIFWWNPIIPSRNLDEVFTYNNMALMSLQSRYHVKASMV